ncbi:hypothetical protein [Streptomyces sp. MAR4 CNX-425]|uniref:hypothetical protein n=1 Tax=Streptomyces sp. MAR4 CNX-425 TaxID=3406343 RepID=UPI003B507497
MTAGSWEQAVREQVALGRLLPLGDAADGAWIAERAASGVLRRAAAGVRGVRVTALRVEPADRYAEGAGGEAGPVRDGGGAGAAPGRAGPESAEPPHDGGDAPAADGTGAGSGSAEPSHDGGDAPAADGTGPGHGDGAGSGSAEPPHGAGRARAADAARRPGERGPGAAVPGPPPVSALPFGELLITAECDAATDRPMTAAADALRAALLRGADERLGLRVAAVDIHVTGLLEAPQNAAQAADGTGGGAPPAPPAPAGPAAAPRVPGLLDADVREVAGHAEVRAVTDARHRALDVATAVRARIPAATVTVLITDIR